MIYPQITFKGQEVSICNRYIQLFRDEHNVHVDKIRAENLRSELNEIMPVKFHGFRLIYLATIWKKVLTEIAEEDKIVVDAKFKEALQAVRKFGRWQRNHYKPTIKRMITERGEAKKGTRQDSTHNPTLADFLIVNGGRKMNLPSKNPHVNEATNLAFAERFLHLNPSAPKDYIEAANDAIAEAKHQAYESVFWDDKLNIEAHRVNIDLPEPPDPFQDFTTFTEVDTPGVLTVTSSRITANDLDRDESVYVYKDFGVDYFDLVNNNFEHLVDTQATSDNGSGANGLYGFWGLSNSLGDASAILTAAGDLIYCYLLVNLSSGGTIRVGMVEIDSGAAYGDIYNSGMSPPQNFFHNISYDKDTGTYGTLSQFIFSDVDRLSSLDTLTTALHSSKKKYRYLYGAISSDAAISGRTIDAYSENMDLQEAAGGTVIFRRRIEGD